MYEVLLVGNFKLLPHAAQQRATACHGALSALWRTAIACPPLSLLGRTLPPQEQGPEDCWLVGVKGSIIQVFPMPTVGRNRGSGEILQSGLLCQPHCWCVLGKSPFLPPPWAEQEQRETRPCLVSSGGSISHACPAKGPPYPYLGTRLSLSYTYGLLADVDGTQTRFANRTAEWGEDPSPAALCWICPTGGPLLGPRRLPTPIPSCRSCSDKTRARMSSLKSQYVCLCC